jgi:hypothetical protein
MIFTSLPENSPAPDHYHYRESICAINRPHRSPAPSSRRHDDHYPARRQHAQASADITSWLILNFGPGTTGKPVHVDIDPIGGKGETKTLQLLTSLRSLYFLMSGIEDNMQIQTADGTKAHVHDGDEGLYFVGITSSTPIASIQWSSHGSFVLSNFGSPEGPAAAPELATWLSVATGLIAIKRRYRVPSAPS